MQNSLIIAAASTGLGLVLNVPVLTLGTTLLRGGSPALGYSITRTFRRLHLLSVLLSLLAFLNAHTAVIIMH